MAVLIKMKGMPPFRMPNGTTEAAALKEADRRFAIFQKEQKEAEKPAVVETPVAATEKPLDQSTTIEEARALEEQLIFDEGRRLKSYLDSEGVPTGGIGHMLTTKEKKKYPIGTSIPEKIVDDWFKKDVAIAKRDVNKLLKRKDVDQPITSEVRSILDNMSFNLGLKRLGGFKEMWKALGNEDFDRVRDEMEASTWFDQVGPRAERLVARMDQVAVQEEEREPELEVPTPDLAESLVEQEGAFEARQAAPEKPLREAIQEQPLEEEAPPIDAEEVSELPAQPDQAQVQPQPQGINVPEDLIASAIAPVEPNPTIVGQSKTPPPSLDEKIRSTLV